MSGWPLVRTPILSIFRPSNNEYLSSHLWISDATCAAIREKREAKGKDKKRYQELKAEVQRKLRVDKQQQLEGMCMELEAANSKGNSRKLFQIVKSMTRKFQPRLQGIQSATGENLTEAAQIADRWKGYCEDLYCENMKKALLLSSTSPFSQC